MGNTEKVSWTAAVGYAILTGIRIWERRPDMGPAQAEPDRTLGTGGSGSEAEGC